MNFINNIPRLPSGWLRLVVDAALVIGCFALALLLRVLFTVLKGTPPSDLTQNIITAFVLGVVILLPCCLFFFVFMGFYNKGRFYQGPFKILIVFQGVTLGFITAGFFSYLLTEFVWFPRGALFIAYVLTAATLILARVGTILWRQILAEEGLKPTRAHLVTTATERRILVIGGAGYIGSALVPQLLEAGYHVRVMDMMVYGEEALKACQGHAKLEILRRDFRQVDAVVEAMQKVDSVVHLGAIVGDPACALDEDLTKEINLMAVKMVADVAKGLDIRRFVFASTCSVYGASDVLLDERSVLQPVSLYARTKIACERILMKMADSTFYPTILRFATIYGLSGRVRFDLVVNLLTAKAMFNKEITVSGGDQWRPFVHVEDAARGIAAVLAAPADMVGRDIFNVGSNAGNFTIRQVGEMIQHEVPEAALREIPFDGDRRNYRVDFSKIQNMLRFKTEWTLPQGIQQIVAAIRSGQITDYTLPAYSNVRHLSAQPADKLFSREREWLEQELQDTQAPAGT